MPSTHKSSTSAYDYESIRLQAVNYITQCVYLGSRAKLIASTYRRPSVIYASPEGGDLWEKHTRGIIAPAVVHRRSQTYSASLPGAIDQSLIESRLATFVP